MHFIRGRLPFKISIWGIMFEKNLTRFREVLQPSHSYNQIIFTIYFILYLFWKFWNRYGQSQCGWVLNFKWYLSGIDKCKNGDISWIIYQISWQFKTSILMQIQTNTYMFGFWSSIWSCWFNPNIGRHQKNNFWKSSLLLISDIFFEKRVNEEGWSFK